jgi:AcrR family transcriptional regulator
MPRRAGLTTEKVVELGLSIVDRAGLDGLSLAQVAEAAGVATPSLYKHVGGLPDLRDRVARQVFAGLTARVREAVIGVSGDAAVRALMGAYRAYLVEFPHRAPLLVAPSKGDEAADQLLGVVLAVLRGFRLEGSEAIHGARALRSTAHGFGMLEAAGGFGYREDLDESFDRLVTMVVNGLRAAAG